MEIRKITDFRQIEDIYLTQMQLDFPSNELKPLIAIEKALEEGIYECYGLYRDRIILGYAFFVKTEKNYLLDYFAISQAYRNRGYGSVFLNRLSKMLSEAECVICEVDDPDAENDPDKNILCFKRLQFYLCNGFRETGVTSTVFGAEFRILVTSGTTVHDDKEIARIYT